MAMPSLFGAGAETGKPTTPEWSQFRGHGSLGVATDGKYASEFGPGKNVRWKTEIPSGVSSPCIWGERIFLSALDAAKQTLETICIERSTGKVLWRQSAPAEKIEKVHKVSSAANATPATDGERVYVYFGSYGLLCYDFAGQSLWRYPIPLVNSRFGSGASPIVADGKVILNHDEESGEAFLLAVDCRTGKAAWKTPRQPSFTKYSTPVLWRAGEGKSEILVGGGQRLVSYDLSTGKEIWWINEVPPQLVGTPVVVADRVFFSGTGMFGEPENFVKLPTFAELAQKCGITGDAPIPIASIPKDVLIVDRRASGGAGNSPLSQFVSGADSDNDKKISKQEWETFAQGFGSYASSAKPAVCCVRLGGHGDVRQSHLIWNEIRGVPEVPSLLVYRDRVYGVRNGGFFHSRNARDGKETYSERLDAPGGYYASPVAGDEKIYVASDRGMVTVIAAGDQFRVLRRNDIQERVIATPALVGGVIYLRTDTKLYAFAE